jgi:hypothetical protein
VLVLVSSAAPESAEPVNALAVLSVPAIGRQVAAAVRLAAVGIGDTVGIGELAGADDRASPAVSIARCVVRKSPPSDGTLLGLFGIQRGSRFPVGAGAVGDEQDA